jgi:hypothetical protein
MSDTKDLQETAALRVHVLVLPPEVKRRAAADRENDSSANGPQPAD